MKKVFIVGVEGTGSGMWDWFSTIESADIQYTYCINTFAHLEGEIIWRGELNVPTDLTNDQISTYVENFLIENDFENAFGNNKI